MKNKFYILGGFFGNDINTYTKNIGYCSLFMYNHTATTLQSIGNGWKIDEIFGYNNQIKYHDYEKNWKSIPSNSFR